MLRKVIISLMLTVGLLVAVPAPAAQAANVFKACNGQNSNAVCSSRNNKLFGPDSVFRRVVNVLLFITGAIALIFVIVGALRYVLSNGDQAALTGAKNTILYALVGLVLSFAAYAIVNFVVDSLIK